jgi:phosphate transport system substrate-binding protein
MGKSQTSVVRIVVFVGIGAALAGVICYFVYFAPNLLTAWFVKEDRTNYVTLKTGGTSNVDLIMENRWRMAYRKEKQVELSYESLGSTEGIKGMTDKKFAIAFTHAPLSEEQRQQARDKGGEVLHIPVVLCAVVPIYNVEKLNDKPALKFTGEVLGKIFLGEIDRWDDPEIQKLNDGVELPKLKITVVHRKDSSGTTFIFTEYLHQASPSWAKKIGPASNVVAWPVGQGEDRNAGVTSLVQQTEGAIGYADLVHAEGTKLKYGRVQNKDQTEFLPVTPKEMPRNITAATRPMLANIPEDLTFPLTSQPGKDAYPISGAIWAVCYRNQSPANRKMLADFLHWVVTDGQRFAATTAYAPLPEELIERAEQRLELLKAVQ